MAGTRTRGSLIRLFAGRLVARERSPRRWNRIGLRLALASLAAGAAGFFGMGAPLWSTAVLAFGILLLGVVLAARRFAPALAVSVVGVGLSCVSMATALAVTRGFEDEVIRSVSRLNGHILLTKYGLDFHEYEELATQFEQHPEVVAASPFAYSMVALVPEAAAAAGEADAMPATGLGKGVDPEWAGDLEGFADLMTSGDLRGFRPADNRHRPGLVLGERLAHEMGVKLGDEIRVVVPAEIDGTKEAESRPPRHAVFELLDTVVTGSSELDRDLAMMHLTAAQALFFREGRATGIEIQLSDPDLADDVAAALSADLPPHYRTTTWRQTNSSMLVGLQQIRATLTVLLGLLMLVAATSVVSSLLLVVRGKQAEIATLLALGGDERLAFWVFEWIGLFVGGVGAVGGTLAAFVIAGALGASRFPLDASVYPVDHLPVTLTFLDVAGPGIAAVLLCGLASGPVASIATRVPVLQALRRA